MADVNLGVGGSATRTVNGAVGTQKLNFYFNYSSSGYLSVRAECKAGSWAFKTTDCYAYITIGGTQTIIQNHTVFQCGNSTNNKYGDPKDFGSASKYYAGSNSSITVQIHIDAYAGGHGPTGRNGGDWSYTVSVPGITSKCKAPTDLWVSSYYVNPGGNVTVSWNGASGGTNNAISRYWLTWGYSDGGWDYGANSYTSSGSSSLSITVPSREGKYLDFQVRTEGTAGTNYYSDYYREDNLVRTRSRPTMSACSATHYNGTTTISWSAATGGVDNPVSKYEIWYSYKSSSSGSWSTRQHLANTANSSTRSYTWTGGTVGYYYRFSVVALGTNYLYSATTDTWSGQIQKTNKYTYATAPTNFTYSILKLDSGQSSSTPYPSQKIELSWSGASGGTQNNISVSPNGYEIQYQTNSGSWYNLDTSVPSSPYEYTIPAGASKVNFRIRTKSIGGSSWYSGYKTLGAIIIGTAPAPSSSTAEISITQPNRGSLSGKQLNLKIVSPFTVNSNYNKISRYNIYYTSSLSGPVTTTDISKYTLWKSISSSYNIPSDGEPFTNVQWGTNYRFAMIAYGQYNGQTNPVFSNSEVVQAPDGVPAQGVEVSGSGVYIDDNGEIKAIGNGYLIFSPYGGTNLSKYELEYSSSSTYSSPSTMDISIGSSAILSSSDSDSGTFYYVRIWSYTLEGEKIESSPLYLNEDLTANGQIVFVSRNELSKKNNENPVVQIKRGPSGIWIREDGRIESSTSIQGVRLEDGELGYETDSNRLKIGQARNTFSSLDTIGEIIGTGNDYPKNKSNTIHGNNNILGSSANNNVIFGYNNKVNSSCSYNLISGRNHEVGYNSSGTWYFNVLSGQYLRCQDDYCAYFGKYNSSYNGYPFVIGWGTSDSNRKDIMKMNDSGDLYISGRMYENVSSGTSGDTVGIPVGGIILFAGWPLPVGYLRCNGTAYSRTTYSELFSLIGTYYGAGDGSTTFNVPNFNGRTAVGVGTATSKYWSRGTSTSTESVSVPLQSHVHSGPSHTHTMNHGHGDSFSTASAGSHSHTIADRKSVNGTETGNIFVESWPNGSNPRGMYTGSAGSHTHTINGSVSSYTGSTGSSGTGNTGSTGTSSGAPSVGTFQPSLGVYYLIKYR